MLPLRCSQRDIPSHVQVCWTQYGAAGQRKFDVKLQGLTYIANLDIYYVAGRNTAYDRAVTINVTNGMLDISLVKFVGDPTVDAIEVRAVTTSSQPTATRTLAPSVTPTRTNTPTTHLHSPTGHGYADGNTHQHTG